MSSAHSQSTSSRQILRWLFSHLAPYKKQVTIALVALMLSSLAWLLLGQGIKQVIDQGFVQNNREALSNALFIVLGVVVFGSIATYYRFYWMVWLGESVCADIRTSLFSHLVMLPPSFFENTRTGEIISRFTSDTTLLQSVVGTGISMALRSFVMFIGALALMTLTSLTLTILVFIAVPLMLIPIRVLGKQVRLHSKLSQDKVASVGGMVDESLHEIHTLQAYNHEKKSTVDFAEKIESVIQQAGKRIHYRALLIAIVMMISLSAIFLVSYVGAIMVLENTLSIGELAAFVFYAVLAGGAIATISEVIGELQKAAGASERILELLQQKSTLKDDGRDEILGSDINHSPSVLSIKHLFFQYPEVEANAPPSLKSIEQKANVEMNLTEENSVFENTTEQAQNFVLENVSFDVKPNEKVAIVGASGAGKSTLFQLLLRFYDCDKGEIEIFGKQIKELPLKTLREQFALVPQDAVIFSGNVSDNIAFSNPHADKQSIENAAKLAHVEEFVARLPQKYDTELGERGVKLSGGQKQRIAIARAILANRPILLLDEATSALDAASEHSVKLALDSLMQSKTTIIIAHRLSTVLNANKIIVLDKGKVIAQGTHQELYNDSQVYKEFVDLQLVNE